MAYQMDGGGSSVPRKPLSHRKTIENAPPLKASEKTLELNVGAEILTIIRVTWKVPSAYLRGLTQAQEKDVGVDVFMKLDPATRVFGFQFKAPRGAHEDDPYRYMLRRPQHELLHDLALLEPGSTFYVFPRYATEEKLSTFVPQLASDTWLADIAHMPTDVVFGKFKSRTAKCTNGILSINPTYNLQRLTAFGSDASAERPRRGIPIRTFGEWYAERRRRPDRARTIDSVSVTRRTCLVFVPPDVAA